MSLKYNGKLISLAKTLRRHATRQENHLWYDFLRRYTPRFQRQKVIGNYIADFYCHEAKLVVELDGSQHYEEDGLSRDATRTHTLEDQGLHILRFSNRQIREDFAGVCSHIDLFVKNSLSQPQAADSSL